MPNVKCYCCGTEKWQYRIWKCSCVQKFYGDKWDYKPICDCCDESTFIAITDGSEYFQLHHLTYKNLGKEKTDELKILCVDCHRLAHHLINLYSLLKIDTVVDYIRNEKLTLGNLKHKKNFTEQQPKSIRKILRII